MEYMKPVDGHMWASVYMYKPRNGKLFFGPLWDFDLGAGSANRAGNVVSSSGWYLRDNLQISAMQPECSSCTKYNTWFNQLNKNSSFRAAKAARWNEVMASGFNVSGSWTRKVDHPDLGEHQYALRRSSHSYRISPYQVIKSNFDADFSYLRSWATPQVMDQQPVLIHAAPEPRPRDPEFRGLVTSMDPTVAHLRLRGIHEGTHSSDKPPMLGFLRMSRPGANACGRHQRCRSDHVSGET